MTNLAVPMSNMTGLALALFGAVGRSRSAMDWSLFVWIGAGAVVLLILLTITIVFVKRQGRNASFSHPALFKQLCHVHGLDRKSRKILKRVADYFRMPQPARLFTEPHWLNPEKLGSLGFADKDVIDNLRKKIFDVTFKQKGSDSP